MKSSKFKLVLLLSMIMLILCCSITAYAAAGDPAKPDKILKYTIGEDTEKHELEHSGTDNLVTFTLPESINQNSDWVADYIEVMLMERLKGETEFEPMIKLDSSDEMRAVVEVEGLDVTLNLGNSENYRTGAQYQILYRVHMTCINDSSLSAWNIPNADYVGSDRYTDMDDPDLGWVLLTDDGDKFIIYTNSDPTGNVEYIIKNEEINLKPAVDPSTLGGSSKVAINKSVSDDSTAGAINSRHHLTQPYANDYRLFAHNYSSVANSSIYTDYIRAYTADVGATGTDEEKRRYKWYVTGGDVLDDNTPISKYTVSRETNTIRLPSSSSIITNDSGWDQMGYNSGIFEAYTMLEMVNMGGTQDNYTITNVDYRLNCGETGDQYSLRQVKNASSSNTETDDGAGNWNKTSKYLSGIVKVLDEDEGDMLGIKVLISGNSYTDYEVFDSGSIIYPNTEYEYKINIADKLDDGTYTYKINIYDDNGGECDVVAEYVNGTIILRANTNVRLLVSNPSKSYTDAEQWSNIVDDSTNLQKFKTFNVRVTNTNYVKNLTQNSDEKIKVRTQYSLFNGLDAPVINRNMVSRQSILGLKENRLLGMHNSNSDGSYTRSAGALWYSNYTADAADVTHRLVTHSSKLTHEEDAETTLWEDGLYGIVASCNDIYGNYIEKVYTGKENAIRIDGHKPTIEDIDSSVPLSDEYIDNSSLSWIKPLDEDGVLNISTEDTIALIGGVQYYSGIDTLDIVRTKEFGTSGVGNTDEYSYSASVETDGDMADISGIRYAEFDTKEIIPSEDGVYSFDITSKDYAGNISDTTTKYVGIDGTGPTIDPLANAIIDEGFEMIKNNDTPEIMDRNPEVNYVTDWVDYKPNLKYGVLIQDITSGVSEVHYGVSNEPTAMTGTWNNLSLESSSWLETEPVNITGIANLDLGNCGAGVKYLHIKAFDMAGNESVSIIKLKLNSIPEINSISVDDTSRSGIYKTLEADVAPNGIKTYIVYKSADYSAFRLNILDADTTDDIEIKYTLTNNETGNVMVEGTKVFEGPQDGSVGVAKAFMVNYQDVHGNDLPDGIYTLEVKFTDIKNDADFDGIAPYNGKYNMPYREDSVVPTVQVVLKRTQPPVPQITVDIGTDDDGVDCKIVSIEYPLETGILNCPELNALILEKYSTSNRRGATPFVDYVTEFNVYETTNVVAQYTDCAGNISTNSLQVLMEGLPEPEDNINIYEGGSDVVVDESRASNTYYIGTRKENDAGINSSEVFSFID